MVNVNVLIVIGSVDVREEIKKAVSDTAKHSWFARFKFEIIDAKSGSDWFSERDKTRPNIIIADHENYAPLLGYRKMACKVIEEKPHVVIFDFDHVPTGGLDILDEIKQQYTKNIETRFKLQKKEEKLAEPSGPGDGILSKRPHHLTFPNTLAEFKGRTKPLFKQRPVQII